MKRPTPKWPIVTVAICLLSGRTAEIVVDGCYDYGVYGSSAKSNASQ